MTDHDNLLALYDRLCATWTAGDAEGYGACFSEDCDYVSYDGTRTRGRSEVVAAHDRLFRGVLVGSALVGTIDEVEFLGSDVALLHGTGSVVVAWRTDPPSRRLTRNTIVAVRGPGGWLVRAIHNGRIRPLTVPPVDSMPSRAARGLVRLTGALGLGRPREIAA